MHVYIYIYLYKRFFIYDIYVFKSINIYIHIYYISCIIINRYASNKVLAKPPLVDNDMLQDYLSTSLNISFVSPTT